MRNQNLFNAIKDVCGFTALQSDMEEIKNAIKKENQMNTTNVPTEWFDELKRLTELSYINEDVDDMRSAKINGQIKAHINCLKYFNQPEQSSEVDLEEFAKDLIMFWSEHTKFRRCADGFCLNTDQGLIPVPFSEVLQAFKQSK